MERLTQKLMGLLAVLAVATWLAGLSACQRTDQVTAPDQTLVPEIPQPDAVASIVTGGTLTEDFALHPPDGDKRRAPIYIWRCLQLDSAQRIAAFACLKSYADSIRAVLDSLRASEQQYKQQAREMRRAVIDSLRQGLLDRETARQRLGEIKQWLREQLLNNPVRQWAAEELARLKLSFCECISQVLTPQQQQIWQCWCSGGTNCCPVGSHDDDRDGDHHGDSGKDHHGDRHKRRP